ncbi:hypothetical protein [Pseudomonas syringae]|uniref:hypothetical protein n=1 Tax=Pseudomonas syringae TaxID=317 RepID=UPI0009B58886|nr:hypothetical protein [Pseudomonas syringae]
MNKNNELLAPNVPAAETDGLIKLSDLTSDLIVTLPVWPFAMPDDGFQLTLDETPVGTKIVLPDPVPDEGTVLTAAIPLTNLDQDKSYAVGYLVIASPGGGGRPSEQTSIRIDRTPAGGPLLAPLLLPSISLANVTGKIPGYIGMEVGDTIQTLCNTAEGPAYIIIAENLTTLPIEITFTREFLESLQSNKVNITYHVTDRAGNQSMFAQSVELTLGGDDATHLNRHSNQNDKTTAHTYALDAPSIPVAQADGLIAVDDLNSNIIIYFPVWLGAHLGIDTNQLMINGVLVGDPVTVPDEATEFSLTIPLATQLKEDGNYDIGYRATSVIGGTPNDSEVTTIRIDRTAPGAAMLAALVFPQVNFGDRLIGRMPGYAGMEVGDLIQTICNGANGPSYLIQTEDLTKSMEISFPREFLQSLESDEVNITYQITDRAGNRSILAEPVDLILQS